MSKARLPSRFWIIFCVALCSLLFLIRLSGPSDLESYGQDRAIGFLLDLLKNGHWLVQHDLHGELLSAPPLHTWILAPFAALFGLNRLALTAPSFLAILTLSVLLLEVGRRRFSEFGLLAGGLSVVAFLLAPTMAKQVALVGNGPVLALVLALAASSAFRAAENVDGGTRDWLQFWGLAAIASLIGGAFGLALIAGGLLSILTTRPPDKNRSASAGIFQTKGIVLFTVLTFGWFGAARLIEGPALIHALLPFGDGKENSLSTFGGFLAPAFSLLIRYLPFSLPLVFALWRIVRHPASNPDERRFERFLAYCLLFGLIAVSLTGGSQNPDTLLPLWPAGALLAGREMARFARHIGVTRFAGIGLVLGIILLGATYAAVHSPLLTGSPSGTESPFIREIRLADDSRQAADAFRASKLDATALQHIDTPASLQLYLGTYRPLMSRDQLQKELAETDRPVDVALGAGNFADLQIEMSHRTVRQLFRWPSDISRSPVLQVFRVSRTALSSE